MATASGDVFTNLDADSPLQVGDSVVITVAKSPSDPSKFRVSAIWSESEWKLKCAAQSSVLLADKASEAARNVQQKLLVLPTAVPPALPEPTGAHAKGGRKSAATPVPAVLQLSLSDSVGGHLLGINGRYRVVEGKTVRGMPVWQQIATIGQTEVSLLFATKTGRWAVGKDAEADTAAAASSRHDGKLPTAVTWQMHDPAGKLVIDKTAKVSLLQVRRDMAEANAGFFWESEIVHLQEVVDGRWKPIGKFATVTLVQDDGPGDSRLVLYVSDDGTGHVEKAPTRFIGKTMSFKSYEKQPRIVS